MTVRPGMTIQIPFSERDRLHLDTLYQNANLPSAPAFLHVTYYDADEDPGPLTGAIVGGIVATAGEFAAADFKATGIGSLISGRFLGSVNGGPPATNLGQVAGDFVVDEKFATLWVWTTGGNWIATTPSLWSARVYLNNAQTIPGGTNNTKLALDTVGGVIAPAAGFSYDPMGLFDSANHRLKATVAGFYSATGLVSGTDQANPQTWQADLAINDVTIVTFGSSYLTRGANAGDLCVSLARDDEIFLNVGDALSLFVSTVMGNPVAVLTGPNNTFLSMVLTRAV